MFMKEWDLSWEPLYPFYDCYALYAIRCQLYMDQAAQIRAKLEALQNPPDWVPSRIKDSIPRYDMDLVNEALAVIQEEYSEFMNHADECEEGERKREEAEQKL
jgi:hypothetical protein